LPTAAHAAKATSCAVLAPERRMMFNDQPKG
jgi:hypothetical protein